MHYRVSVHATEKDLIFKVNENLDVLDMDEFIKDNVENFLDSMDADRFENVYVEFNSVRNKIN